MDLPVLVLGIDIQVLAALEGLSDRDQRASAGFQIEAIGPAVAQVTRKYFQHQQIGRVVADAS